MHRIAGFAIVIASVIGTGGCGGGGGGDSSAPAATAEITTQNATVIAGAVAGTAIEGQALADLGSIAAPIGASTGNVTVAHAHVGTPETAEVTVGPETQACLESGTMSFSADIENPDTLTAGDSFQFDFSSCSQGDGVLIDGGFDFVVSSFQGDAFSELFELDIAVNLSNLQISDGSIDTTIDGDLNLVLDTSNSPAITVTVTSDSLTTTSGPEFASLADYSTTISIDPQAGTVSISSSGYLMTSEFDGEVRFATTQSLQLDASENPVSGHLVITGADGATIEVTLLGQDQVQLDVDVDGDGLVDEVIMTSWTELLT